MEVFEGRRSDRKRQMCSVGCEIACTIDWCAHSGKELGAKWQAIMCNEDSSLVASLTTKTTSLNELRQWLTTIKERPNFNPKVCLEDSHFQV